MLTPGERGEIFAIVQPEDTVRALDLEGAAHQPDVLVTSRPTLLIKTRTRRRRDDFDPGPF